MAHGLVAAVAGQGDALAAVGAAPEVIERPAGNGVGFDFPEEAGDVPIVEGAPAPFAGLCHAPVPEEQVPGRGQDVHPGHVGDGIGHAADDGVAGDAGVLDQTAEAVDVGDLDHGM